jgi:uncharacterized protein (TIGR00255 family)
MIRSMTGFARRERQGSWGTLVCELRTVNHRYLELALRLPEELRALEGEARQAVSAALKRGKVDAIIHLKSAATANSQLEINQDALRQILARASEVAALAGQTQPLNVLDLLRWPGVVRDAERDLSPAVAATLELLREALKELNDVRAREGGRMREVILQRCDSIASQVALVRSRLPEVNAKMRARLTERVSQLSTTINPERLEQELAIFATRMDVDEELDRLEAHLKEVRSILDGSEPAGRRLDFLMQELNREANTLSSKSQDVETTRAGVDMKVAIEQMREQIQNIE